MIKCTHTQNILGYLELGKPTDLNRKDMKTPWLRSSWLEKAGERTV